MYNGKGTGTGTGRGRGRGRVKLSLIKLYIFFLDFKLKRNITFHHIQLHNGHRILYDYKVLFLHRLVEMSLSL
jgi:hypothetical protein